MNSLTWVPSKSPLKAAGLITTNDTAAIQRLINLDSERIMHLRGIYSKSVIVLLGDECYLPWMPSATYLGKINSAPNLLIPTHLLPSFPIDWLGRAVEREFGEGQFALDPVHKQLFNTSGALSVSVSKLRGLLNETA